jgi:hypothetical protein
MSTYEGEHTIFGLLSQANLGLLEGENILVVFDVRTPAYLTVLYVIVL